MDKHVMHNLIHGNYGNEASQCPVCNSSIKSEEEMLSECNRILRRQQTMYSHPQMYDDKTGMKIKGRKGVLKPLFQFSEDGKLPDEILLVPVMKKNTLKYGEVEVTFDDIKQMEENFNKNVRKGVMVDVDHGSSQYGDAAAGWIKKVEARKDGLYATEIEWTKLGEELVGDKIYKFLSPEFNQIYIDPEDADTTYENVLIATSLVNRPLLKGIPALTASEDLAQQKNLTNGSTSVMIFIEPMNIDQILAKKASERTSEEVAFLASHKDSLTDDQKKILADEEATATAATTKVTDPTGTGVKEDTAVKATEKGNIVMSEDEVKRLRDDAEKGRLAFREMEKGKLKEEYNKMVFSEAGGRIAPASVDKIVDFVIDLNEDQRKAFNEVLETLPEKKIFGELGSSTSTTMNQQADLATAEVKKVAQEKGIKFSEALDIVKKEKPELFKDYTKNLTAGGNAA